MRAPPSASPPARPVPHSDIAVIGAGPAGISAAQVLASAGFGVTIFEAHDDPGGMVAGAIPAYRLPQAAIDADLAIVEGLGVTARVITAAAAIMIVVFMSFVFTKDPIQKQFGVGLAAAILVDATIVRMILEKAGYDVLEAENGEAAIAALNTGENRLVLDVVICDIRMPKMSGIEVLRQIKADEETRTIPVVMMTSSDEPGDIGACYRLGANSYVVKRYDTMGPGRYLAIAMRYWLELNRAPGPSSWMDS